MDDVSTETGALLARVAQGDERAFAALYEELAPTLYGIALRVVGDRAQAEEVTHEAFVEIWRTAARFDPARDRVRGWAVMIAHRRAIHRVRSDRLTRGRRRRDTPAQDAPGTSPGAAIASLDRDRARQQLRRLGDGQREALELAFLDGMTHVEIDEQLGVARGTAKARIRDGLIRLRSGSAS
jgi:RNA polymerase sigma-70 factor (ECF subfamily)